MIECQHVESQRWDKPDSGIIKCRVLQAATGLRCACHHRVCEQCLASGLAQEPASDPRWVARIKGAMISRLVSGDLPRYQQPDPVDVPALFARFIALAAKDRERDGQGRFVNETEARDLLKRMFAWQAAIPQNQGGHPTAVLVSKFDALAKAHGMEHVLEEIVSEHANAQDAARTVPG